MKHVEKENATFRGGTPNRANACVGENGNPQIIDYAEGYAAAANLLINQVIQNDKLPVDTFVYPIVFNMRHAVELFLKSAATLIGQLHETRSIKTASFDLSGSHDIGNIWAYVKQSSQRFDERYIEITENLDEFISDIAQIDSTGQVFRYPFDTENKKHLTSISVINIVTLRRRWSVLQPLLKGLNYLNNHLLTEYRWGAFTSKLSRVQLARIAETLPPRTQWGSELFSLRKVEILGKYNLSSNDFSRALAMIQSRRELASLLGSADPIPHLAASDIVAFFDIWIRDHDLAEIITPPENDDLGLAFDPYNPDFDELAQNWQKTKMLAKEITERIPPNSFAALRALYYFDNEDSYSEVFELLLKENLDEAATHTESPSEYMQAAENLLNKHSALQNILNSLNFLGQSELLDVVFKTCKLEDHANKLLHKSNIARARLVQYQSFVYPA